MTQRKGVCLRGIGLRTKKLQSGEKEIINSEKKEHMARKAELRGILQVIVRRKHVRPSVGPETRRRTPENEEQGRTVVGKGKH